MKVKALHFPQKTLKNLGFIYIAVKTKHLYYEKFYTTN